MNDSSFMDRPGSSTVADTAVSWRAESLLTVIAPLLQAMQAAEDGSVESAHQLYMAKQTFRDCAQSLCGSLTVEETQDLLSLSVITLCERLVDVDAAHQT